MVFVVLAFLEALPPPMKRRVEPCIGRKKSSGAKLASASCWNSMEFRFLKVERLKIPLGEMASKCCETHMLHVAMNFRYTNFSIANDPKFMVCFVA